MLKAIPKTWWSYTFSVVDGAQSVAQALDVSWWRDQGELQVDGTTYTARRDKSSYVLESAAGVVVRAERPSMWVREFVIEHSGHRYTLRKKTAFRREFELLEDSTPIGSVVPDGFFTRNLTAKLPQALPLALRVFVIWVVVTLWKHDDSAS